MLCAALLSGAFFLSGVVQTVVLVVLMCFAPLFDRRWAPGCLFNKRFLVSYILLGLAGIILLILSPVSKTTFVHQLFFVSLPEELFFRVYLLQVLGMSVRANLLSSAIFSVLHALTRGWEIGLQVFIPSLLFGAVYMRWKDATSVVLLHLLSNLLFIAILNASIQ